MIFIGLVTTKQNDANSTNSCNITRPRRWRKRGGWCYLFTTKWILGILRVGWMGPRRGTASNGEGLSCKTESQPSVAVVQLAPTTYIWHIYRRHTWESYASVVRPSHNHQLPSYNLPQQHISESFIWDIYLRHVSETYMGDIYLSCRTQSPETQKVKTFRSA